MPSNITLARLIHYLKKKGWSDTEIVKLINYLTTGKEN